MIRCPVPGCAGLGALFWDNRHQEQVREGRRKVYRRVMVAGLGRCATSGNREQHMRPRHSEAEMLAALGDDLQPFTPVPAPETP